VTAPVYVCVCGHLKSEHIRTRRQCRFCGCLDFSADLKASAALQGVELSGAAPEGARKLGDVTTAEWRAALNLPPLMPGGESTSARLRRVEQEMDAVRGTLTEMAALYDSATAETARVAQERDQLATAVAGWVARFHAAYEALCIEEFDGDSCPDLETTIEYAIAAYRRVCASEAAAADQIDLLRAELTSARTELEHKRGNAEIRARVVRDLHTELEQLRTAHGWIVAHDGGRDCERCDQEIRRGEAYEFAPGDDPDGLRHIHCRNEE